MDKKPENKYDSTRTYTNIELMESAPVLTVDIGEKRIIIPVLFL